mgnify:CR=1 FL=1
MYDAIYMIQYKTYLRSAHLALLPKKVVKGERSRSFPVPKSEKPYFKLFYEEHKMATKEGKRCSFLLY